MRALRALLVLALAGCPGAAHSVGARVTMVAQAPSGKTLAIYESETFESEPRDVPEEVVVQGMRASSMFFEEDIRALVPNIAPALAKLEEDQRLVIETSDTAVHVFVAAATGELQFVSFRHGHEVSRHASAIPAAAVKTELTVKPRPATPQAQPQPQSMKTEPVAQPVTPPEPVKPVAKPAKPAAKPAKPAARPAKPAPKSSKPQPKLGEAEIRKKLDELERLRAKGLITDAEYDQKRKALLDQL